MLSLNNTKSAYKYKTKLKKILSIKFDQKKNWRQTNVGTKNLAQKKYLVSKINFDSTILDQNVLVQKLLGQFKFGLTIFLPENFGFENFWSNKLLVQNKF